MLAFTVSGTIRGMAVAVTWRAGRLEGSPWELDLVQFELDLLAMRDETVGLPTGPFFEPPYIDKPLGALLALLAVFDPEPAVTGRVPMAPSLPPGAIP